MNVRNNRNLERNYRSNSWPRSGQNQSSIILWPAASAFEADFISGIMPRFDMVAGEKTFHVLATVERVEYHIVLYE
jgi:hypothetical protein